MRLGCLGDDFTGSSDLANTLAREGMNVTQYCGVPSFDAEAGVEAGVVALKTRTAPVAEAVAQSLLAADWLLAQGCRQLVFKVCSTFDSTPDGNIGPVIEALMDRLGTDRAVVCPAFPTAGRRLFQGHLFVGDRLLNESGMEHHPLTPMRDPDIRRWLQLQARRTVGHVAADRVFAGSSAIAEALDAEVRADRPIVVVDAVRDEDLRAIGKALQGVPFVVGGSGIALGLPANFPDLAGAGGAADGWIAAGSVRAAALSGSCSAMTRAQVERHRQNHASLEVRPDALMADEITARDAASWVLESSDPLPLVYSSAEPETVRAAQARFGTAALAERIERFFSDLATRLAAGGIGRLIVAGGETSGAAVTGLALPALRIGPEIATGVPAVRATDRPLWLALKSGNFGGPDFFQDAARVLEGASDVA